MVNKKAFTDISDVRMKEGKSKALCHICKTALLPILTILPRHQLNFTSHTLTFFSWEFCVFVLEKITIGIIIYLSHTWHFKIFYFQNWKGKIMLKPVALMHQNCKTSTTIWRQSEIQIWNQCCWCPFVAKSGTNLCKIVPNVW